jgi:hypothetical protein
VVVGIETDRGAWAQALLTAGYQVYAVSPRQAARGKERYGTSGAKNDKGDARALADVVRIDRAQLRPLAGDSEQAQAVTVVARAHQSLSWERTRTFQRLRCALREYFPGALTAYGGLELTSTDALEPLVKAPTPEQAAKLTKQQITAVLTRHRHRDQSRPRPGDHRHRRPARVRPEAGRRDGVQRVAARTAALGLTGEPGRGPVTAGRAAPLPRA